jgi:hypothetical protein
MLSWFRALMPREERPMEYSAGIALDQSTLMPAALMIGHHLGTSNNSWFWRFCLKLSERVQGSCPGEPPIGSRFDAWLATTRCVAGLPHGLHP